jgi:hypothetical protein
MIAVLSVLSSIKGAVGGVFQMNESIPVPLLVIGTHMCRMLAENEH